MATLQQQRDKLMAAIKTYTDNGMDIATEKAELAQLEAKIRASEGGNIATATRPAASLADTGYAVLFTFDVNAEGFESGGQAFNPPDQEGIWASKLIEVRKAPARDGAAPGRNQYWFVVHTNDKRLQVQGKGTMTVTTNILAKDGDGSFKLKDVLEALKIPYTRAGNKVQVQISTPMNCYSEWKRITDGNNNTSVRVQNLLAAEGVESL